MDHSLSLRQRHSTKSFSQSGKRRVNPPLSDQTLKRVNEVIRLFQDIEAGHQPDGDNWIEYPFDPEDYEELERVLDRNEELSAYVHERIRYDYDPLSHRLAVQMPKRIHDRMIALVEERIARKIASIRKGSDTAAKFARNLQSGLSEDFFLPSPNDPTAKSKHEPDATFWYGEDSFPGVILEVSYSNKKNLRRLAKKYILRSEGNVRAVIGLDIAYRMDSLEAKLTVWRADRQPTGEQGLHKLYVTADVTGQDEVLRDAFGNPTKHSGLKLRLTDFAHPDLTGDITEEQDREITISATTLITWLRRYDDQPRGGGTNPVIRRLPEGTVLETESEESTEELEPEDEERFARQEEMDEERAERRDRDFFGA
ncbi:hypothetical protein BU24DRAFT_423027 [Aaosphaeria arxii CBS 175.79]|uniref:Uncharacterized protein n=1 Tax=Aaosphaeria arxii CBS 175.79 TaxID=1450172 RepID=A0A6A5XUP2_9PLEO|nr:uncharacterized protein BU24DRAFT_423027 [Aaosphaeria arxii CBS 175.79]KAF2016649.1 hypothetical protein BU24DRAFT_423027 [Aaosphaeria arxii CBS 175.79]